MARRTPPPLAPLLALLALFASPASGATAKPHACSVTLLQKTPETFRQCLQHNADLIFPTFYQSKVLVDSLQVMTGLLNAEMTRRHLDTMIAPPTKVTLGKMRLRVLSVRPFRLHVFYPRLAGTPKRSEQQRRGSTRGKGDRTASTLTSSSHETSVRLVGRIGVVGGVPVFSRLDIVTVRFGIASFVVARGAGAETVSLSKTIVREQMHVGLNRRFLKFASVMLEFFSHPV